MDRCERNIGQQVYPSASRQQLNTLMVQVHVYHQVNLAIPIKPNLRQQIGHRYHDRQNLAQDNLWKKARTFPSIRRLPDISAPSLDSLTLNLPESRELKAKS
jgi:hypothetical protein